MLQQLSRRSTKALNTSTLRLEDIANVRVGSETEVFIGTATFPLKSPIADIQIGFPDFPEMISVKRTKADIIIDGEA